MLRKFSVTSFILFFSSHFWLPTTRLQEWLIIDFQHITINRQPMNTLKFVLALTVCIFLSFGAKAKIIKAASLAEAIQESNTLSGKDSLYLSDFISSMNNKGEQYNITDQLVLINDLGVNTDLLMNGAILKVAITGTLDLVGFDLTNINSRVINLGKITLENCVFKEGKDLTLYFNNKGLFEIKNGKFGSETEGVIIRDAYFKVGARVIL